MVHAFLSRIMGRGKFFLPLIILLFSLLYLLTAQQGYSWQDSGEYQFRVLAGEGYQWTLGIAREHPLYIAGARIWSSLFPDRLQVWSINLFSGLGMTLALIALAGVLSRLTRSIPATLLALLTLGFSHMVWWMSCMAEVYTWSIAFLLSSLYILYRFLESRSAYFLLLLFFLNGLHLSVHNFALFELPFYLFILFRHLLPLSRSRQTTLLLLSLLAYSLGSAPIIRLCLSFLLEGHTVVETLQNLLFGKDYQDVVLGGGPLKPKLILANYALAAFSLVNPCWLLSLRGIFTLKRSLPGKETLFKRLLLGLSLMHLIFWIRYFVSDQATFILPTLALLSIWTGIGAASLPRSREGRILLPLCLTGLLLSILSPPIAGRALSMGRFSALVKRQRSLPGRDETSYWLSPWKSVEKSAQRFVHLVDSQLKPGDLLIADTTTAAPLLAARARGDISREWTLLTYLLPGFSEERGIKAMQKADRIYIVSPTPGYVPLPILLNGTYRFVREGILYRVPIVFRPI